MLLLLGLAVGGQGIRAWLARPGEPPGQVTLVGAGLPASSALAHRDSSLALARPLAPGERIDLDQAPAAEIARLPRIGMRMAKAIVADRVRHGPFGALGAVDRVQGVGPGLLAALEPHVRFSRLPAEKPPAGAVDGVAAPPGPPGPIDLNQASREELERLPFLGPYMAEQIVAWRRLHGPFPAVDSLVRVPGVGPATLERVRPYLLVR